MIDNITLSKEEENNLCKWLPNNYRNVLDVLSGDSKDFKFIQMADMIANSFSKNDTVNLDSYDIKILNPFIELFPKYFKDLYIKNNE